MKFSKIIVVVLLLFSPANANTIFYLIKIPNLEIYNSNSANGLKYLKATKAFQVGIRDNSVLCSKQRNETVDEKFNIIKKNLDRYSYDFLYKINLKYIVLCENLSVSDIGAAGIPNYKMKTIIINTNFNKYNLGRTVHHELFHIINENYKNYFNKNIWSKFNNSKFEYAECSTCSDKLDLTILKKNEGFVTEYSMSTISEDMAEVFSFLMVDKKKIEDKALKDPILKKKIIFIKKNVLEIDKNFKF
tara:strand:+ start:639 stop:1376 length:738 start_codon:yes stop_codon:yes gene_type:complete